MTKGRLIALIAALAVVVIAAAGGVVWWRTHPEPPPTQPASADPVAIAVPNAPRQLTIGVIVTLSSEAGQGDDWKYAAEGAQVAVRRLAMGGITVKLETADDKGTADGAEQAVHTLAGKDVSGIVVASEGSHLEGAVKAAAQEDVPLLLPYAGDPQVLDAAHRAVAKSEANSGELVWSTAPMADTVGRALSASLKAAKLTKPLVIDAGGGIPASVEPTSTVAFAPGGDTTALIKKVQRVTKPGGVDSIVVSGPAEQQATVVQALQGASIGQQLFLTPDATSPAFTDALVKAGGSLSTSLATVGPDWGDAVALRSDADGRAMSSFLSAVRMLAADADATTLLGDQPFSIAAGAADVRSHDAVLALVRAAAAARSGTAADVAAALPGLTLDHDSGLAGPSLDFGEQAALVPQSVVALRSSDQDLGLRPADEESTPRLIWFARPAS